MTGKWLKRRFFILALCAVVLLGTGAAALWVGDAPEAVSVSGITDWGLSFQQEGAAPLANATEDYLRQFRALYVGDTGEKTLYITFDAGFENGNTGPILDALKKHGVKATFFLVGNYLETQPELVKRMAEEGHTVGNHTYSHPDMSKIGDRDSFSAELQKNEELYRTVTGQEMPKLYRPPQGKFCESNLQMAADLGYTTVFWSLAYVDWYTEDQPTKEQAFSKLIPRIHNGAVVLLHSTSSTNAQILDALLTEWENLGYTFGDLEAYCAGLAVPETEKKT
ncbi:MAG: polysaccharide deacetylase family protein [Clostridia bacterium]|nr:polysaccharide deacetylase family protein [Clostridia bacterium]